LPIWYIGSRFYFYDNSSVTKKKIAFATFIETALTGLSGVFVLIIFMGFFKKEIIFGIILLVFLFLLMYFFKRRGLIQSSINFLLIKIHKEPIELNFLTKDWLKLFFLYATSWLFAGFSFYFSVKTVVEITLSPTTGILFSIISGLVGYMSMLLPAGFGLKELTTGFLFSQSIPIGLGIILGIINRIFTTIIEIVWSLIFMFISRNNP